MVDSMGVNSVNVLPLRQMSSSFHASCTASAVTRILTDEAEAKLIIETLSVGEFVGD